MGMYIKEEDINEKNKEQFTNLSENYKKFQKPFALCQLRTLNWNVARMSCKNNLNDMASKFKE